MQILQRQNKGSHLNTIERFYIYAEYLNNNHLNDEHTIFPSIIFEALLKPHQPQKKNPSRPHSRATTPKTQHKTYAKTSNITDTQQYKKLPHWKMTHVKHCKYKQRASLTVDKFT